MIGERDATNHTGPGDADPGGDGSGGESLGGGYQHSSGPISPADIAGRVHRPIAELRAAALMARARRPPSARRAILDLGIATGQPWSDVANLTMPEVEYVVEVMKRRMRG